MPQLPTTLVYRGVVYMINDGGILTLTVGELDDEVYATPAIAGGRIFVRTRSALYCFGS